MRQRISQTLLSNLNRPTHFGHFLSVLDHTQLFDGLSRRGLLDFTGCVLQQVPFQHPHLGGFHPNDLAVYVILIQCPLKHRLRIFTIAVAIRPPIQLDRP